MDSFVAIVNLVLSARVILVNRNKPRYKVGTLVKVERIYGECLGIIVRSVRSWSTIGEYEYEVFIATRAELFWFISQRLTLL
jgi:hypothetical protein